MESEKKVEVEVQVEVKVKVEVKNSHVPGEVGRADIEISGDWRRV